MKKVSFLLATLLIGGMMLTGCKKPEPTPEPEPTPTKHTVVYSINNTYLDMVMSPCFKVNVTYTDANGQSITENNATLPWTKSIEVTLPFHAKMEGAYTFNEADLPDYVYFGKCIGIGLDNPWEDAASMGGLSKQKFLEYLADHPEHLQFTKEKDF